MAWFAKSIANSLKIDDEEEDNTIKADSVTDQSYSPSVSQSQSPRGVKEDISDLTNTLRSRLWGVASFLSPPSDSSDHKEGDDDDDDEEEDLIAGIKNDFVEIGGRFRNGISKLSGNIQVSEFTKIASSFLQIGSEEEEEEVVVGDVIGLSEEVVAFAKDLALHPETWLDFPFPEEDDNFADFEMTDAQYEHALAVEKLASGMSALRIAICPAYMSESCFWRIYFVFVHPKFSKDDALLLSTPKVLEARALLSHELHKRNKATEVVPASSSANAEPLSLPTTNEPMKTISVQAIHSSETSEIETEKHTVESKEINVVDKPVIEERQAPVCYDKSVQIQATGSSPKVIDVRVDEDDDDEADDWLKDEDNQGTVTKHLVMDENENVSFSDFEDDDDDDVVPVSYKK
ncbi:unnamed protein product [Cochlearia groenlandica]